MGAVIKPKPKAAGPVSAGRVKSFVERIEHLEEERKAIGSDVRDVYAEAKGVGYDVKTLRWMVQERKVDAVDRDERDALRDTYAHALGLAVDMVRVEGLSLRQAEDATGVSKSSIQRALSVPEVSQVEMTEDDLGTAEPIREMTADDLGDPLLVIDKERGKFRDMVRTLAATIKPMSPGHTVIVNPDTEIDLTIPDFLRRERASA